MTIYAVKKPRREKKVSVPALKRSGYLKRKTAVTKRNPSRRQSEFARCYGSRERVAFVKSLGCVVCRAVNPLFGLVSLKFPIHNAHTVTGGAGRKADYQTIVPLCTSHHRCYDEHIAPLDDAKIRQAIKNAAVEVERRWQEYRERAA